MSFRRYGRLIGLGPHAGGAGPQQIGPATSPEVAEQRHSASLHLSCSGR